MPDAQTQPQELLGGILGNLVTNGSQTNQILGKILQALSNTGTIAATGSITSSSPTGGVGYATGAGGIVTQATSKSTGVTLNKVAGQITMNNASLASSTSVTFTVTNSAVTAIDVPWPVIASGNTSNSYSVSCTGVRAGAFDVTLRNTSGGSLSEAVVLNFVLMRGATA